MKNDASSLTVSFHDKMLSAEERAYAEQSVVAMRDHAVEPTIKQRAEEDRRNALLQKINAPVQRLIDADAEASAAFAELQKMSRYGPEDAAYTGDAGSSSSSGQPMPEQVADRAYFARPPFEYSWASHFQNGSPPYRVEFGPPNSGFGQLEGRTGDFPGARGDFLVISAGYGMGFRSDVRQIRTGHTEFGRLSHYFNLAASGINAWSLAEGGVDWCAFENGRMIASGGRQLWRVRLSVGESRNGPGESPDFRSPGLSFEVHPGRHYNFNLGLWVRMQKSGSSPFGNCGGQGIQRAQIKWISLSG